MTSKQCTHARISWLDYNHVLGVGNIICKVCAKQFYVRGQPEEEKKQHEFDNTTFEEDIWWNRNAPGYYHFPYRDKTE